MDDLQYRPRNRNPREKANLLSVLTFTYTLPTFIQGYRKAITEEDIQETFSEHKSSHYGEAAIEKWQNEVKNSKPSLYKVIFKLLIRDFLPIGIAYLVLELIIKMLQSILLGELVLVYSSPERKHETYIYAGGVILSTFFNAALWFPAVMGSHNIALKMRVICSSLVYHKVLKLSNSSRDQTTPGLILNLISNDINMCERLMVMLDYLWIAPIQTIIALCLMCNELGVASVLGIAILVFFIPISFVMGRIAKRNRIKLSIERDHRLRLINEIIQGIQVIKMYVWENAFSKMIAQFRKLELRFLKRLHYVRSIPTYFVVVTNVALFATVLSSVLINERLTAKSVFISITLFSFLGKTLGLCFVNAITLLSEFTVAIKRIEKFLLCDETKPIEINTNDNNAVGIRNGRLAWDKEFVNLDMEIKSAGVTAIVGSVGSGKSYLLNVILGEIPLQNGNVTVNGSISYASQEPWIFSSTIRQNITFGSEMNEARYKAVINCCALERDLKSFPYGDMTTVGDNGTSLSGGQKARISLARAVYRTADIYLLDDPLSAVDTHVGKQIFKRCIKTFLDDKTVILVTHQLQYLKHVNHIVVMENGSVLMKGTRSELEISGFNFAKYLVKESDYQLDQPKQYSSQSKTIDKPLQKPKMVQNRQEKKFISLSTYRDYFCASKSYTLIVITLLVLFLAEFTSTGSFYLLTHWVNMEESPKLENSDSERRNYMLQYGGVIIASIVFAVLRSVAIISLTLKSSRVLHKKLFDNVVYATMNFFHTNSFGVILNRFSRDMGTTDEMLTHALMIAIRSIFRILGILTIICIVNPWFLVPTLLMLVILYYLRKFYLTTNLNILRVEGKVRGPLYNYLNATIQGLPTIRAFGVQDLLTKQFYHHQDVHVSVLHMAFSTTRAFCYWIDLLTVMYIATITLYYAFVVDSYAGNVGLVISQATNLMLQLTVGIKSVTDVEYHMISVERILKYDTIERERKLENKLPLTWPKFGEIHFEDVSVKYLETNPYVLKNLNITIKPLHKIGIVGRTGAGKSSIVNALFQLVQTEGRIVIDDINISTISLHDLRKKISIIPQNPVLFSGSLRCNLDPDNEYEDDSLWMALEEVGLKKLVHSLELEISQSGSNFSVGQQQLICLARALLRNNKILILDEATANIDLETDEIIQKTIRKRFSNCTILTIAHRLNTVMDSHKLLVMDAGVCVEFDHAHILLQNPDGVFYNMVQQTESTMIQTLKDIAYELTKMEDRSHYMNRNKNPREKANLLSILTLTYALPILFKGYRNTITEDDILETFSEHKSTNYGDTAVKLWQDELKKTKPSLHKLILKLLIRDYLVIGISYMVMELVIKILQSVLLGKLVQVYSDPERRNETYIYAASVILCVLLGTIILHPAAMGSINIALKMRVICCCLVYRKVLAMSNSALEQTTPGRILNLISNDIQMCEKLMINIDYLWIAPIQTIITLSIMYQELGITSLFGLGILVSFIPLSFIIGKVARKNRMKLSLKRDQRLRLINELIQGIHVIKMYAWEKAFSKIITKTRSLEMHSMKIVNYVKSIPTFYGAITSIALFVTVVSSVLNHHDLTAKSVFVVVTLFATIGKNLTLSFTTAITSLNEFKVTISRIQTFLLCEEPTCIKVTDGQKNAVIIKNSEIKWENVSSEKQFTNLDIEILSSCLTVVVGSVGSGKSCFLNVILGEIPLKKGNISVNGTISYTSQEPWIFSSSIRQNILFGSEMNETRYRKVIECCALERDLKLLPFGDKTIVGEKGILLSGGQRARISLARTVYREADIYLLDDPMSAVDTQVGKQIFEECIQMFLNGKTVVLVTHQLQYLQYANYIIVLDNGVIIEKGTRDELEKCGFDFVKYLSKHKEEQQNETEHEIKFSSSNNVIKESKLAGVCTKPRSISWATYKGYFWASRSYLLIVMVLLSVFLTEFSSSSSYYFLTYWINMEEGRNSTSIEMERTHSILIYSGIVISTILFSILRCVSIIQLTIKSARALHQKLLENVTYATLKFFYANSSGAILNLFARDMAAIDEVLPHMLTVTSRSLLGVVGTFGIICFVNVWFFVPIMIMIVILYYLRSIYLASNLNMLRVEGRVRGPLYSHVNETIQGLTIIRAFNAQDVLTEEFYHHQDIHSSAIFTASSSTRVFSYWIDLINVGFVVVLTLYYTFIVDTYGSNIGLVISQAMQLMGQLSYGVKNITDVESSMISVERILEYNSIERERGIKHPAIGKPSPAWPDHGEIKFQNVYVRYSQTFPYALKDINLTIRPLEKIGIVGRTGAGKSSIISALFQLVETEGSIIIDNVNIETVQLHDLRTKLSTIPQDPVLFSGSMRYNLDPFDEYDDNVLWKALEDVQLKNVVDNLESEITIDGSNFSVGQRQLICLARAIVRNNKILILDEATANVDLETDAIIQKTIRSKFSHCTVLTVAHRLNTVMDSDRILVMDEGMAIEFAHPHLLLQNKNGAFYNLVQQTEAVMAESLIEIAREVQINVSLA
ncbi:hypothetical protein RI129_004398 [Pyrocoelia pectoralis]|uniref:Multidrug resistance-associated protein lethal(2)03659 n=1 Tax=Pyrocoelia pectoralis TaxID=417401 RepID=A0AAN7VLF9_9COLE